MSTTYTLFTEVQVADKWYCVSPLMRIVDHIIDPAESELALVPTFETNARYHFEKTYYLMCDDGYPVKLEDLSDDLQSESAKPYTDFADPTLAINYERITGYLNLQLKEHRAFALRSDVAAFENGQEEDIYDYVCLALPMQRTHEPGGCNPDAMKYLSTGEVVAGPESEENNPFAALKGMFK